MMQGAQHQLAEAVEIGPVAEGSELRVLVADDHPLLLAGLRRALDNEPGIEVVGQATTASELLGLIERRRPGVVLTDLRMPGVEGFDLIARIHQSWPEIKLVVLSASDDHLSVSGALAAGASAFIIKSTAVTDVAAVLRQVNCGAVYHPPAVKLSATGAERADGEGAESQPSLTAREREILAAVSRGRTTAEISRELWVSEHTVKFHLTNIYRKLGVGNRSGAVRLALEYGLAD